MGTEPADIHERLPQALGQDRSVGVDSAPAQPVSKHPGACALRRSVGAQGRGESRSQTCNGMNAALSLSAILEAVPSGTPGDRPSS